MINISQLSKRYGPVLAVDQVSLEVKPGEIFVCLGPNGAGKTTIIKILAGLLRPSHGTARIGGFDVEKEYLQAKKLLSYIPDFPFLYEKLTGTEFLDFMTSLYPERKNSRTEGLRRELLEQFGLDRHRDFLIEHYSHGMRQKLIFTAAFLHTPEVMIIDEPMVGLDPYSNRIVKNLLKERSSRGGTVFLSTHQLAIAEELADRIGIIDRGKLIACGTLAQLQESAGDEKLEDIFLRLTQEERP